MRSLLALSACLMSSAAFAQNPVCPTRPAGDSTNACASTAFVQTAVPLAAITSLTGPVTATGPGAAATTVGAGVITNSNLANMLAATVKCRQLGQTTGAPQDCSRRVIDVTDPVYGADPTGVTANFGTAFNAAMTQCVSGGALGIALNGTVYIPQGFYKLGSTVMTWSKGCNIVADPGAYIQANTSIANMLVSGTGSSNSLDSVQLIGGQWDCNANVTQDGFKIPDFARVHLAFFRMYGCSGNAGNGSIGGFIRLGAASVTQSFEMHIENAFMYNFTSPVSSLVTGNYGIFSDPGSTGVNDSRFDTVEIVGTSIGVQGKFFDGVFHRMHVYVFPAQGNMTNGFQLTSGQAKLLENDVDGPLASGKAAFDLTGTPYTMVANSYLELTNNNISNAVNLASGVNLYSFGNHWLGGSSSFKINTDYTGTLTGLVAFGDYTQNVSTIVGPSINGAWKPYTPSPSCGTATFTVNTAHFTNTAKETKFNLDLNVSAIGTCTNQGVGFTLPNTPAGGGGAVGRDTVSTGGSAVCSFVSGSTSAFCSTAGNLTGTSRFVVSGTYENQ